jgi:hypothetical protein
MATPLFSRNELDFISDKTLFERKAEVTRRVIHHLSELQEKLMLLLLQHKNKLPENVLNSTPKISRGENYNGFPWLVLDFPRVFTTAEVFSFRTLFWWGHSWVLTFQLSGHYFHLNREVIFSGFSGFADKTCKIGLGNDPWIHNPDDAMFVGLNKLADAGKSSEELFRSQSFLKLVKKTEFARSEQLIQEAIDFYSECIRLLPAMSR